MSRIPAPPLPPEVVVIGGANVDLVSRPAASYEPGTSNPGTSTLSAGGVARNIAEGLARLGARTSLFTVVGADTFAGVVLNPTRDAGVDTSLTMQIPGASTGVYNAILDEHGELVGAVSAMSVMDALTPDLLEGRRDRIGRARWIVADGNLGRAALEWALATAGDGAQRLALDPVSTPKARRLLPLIGHYRIALLTPNQGEFQVLTGETGDDAASLRRGCTTLHDNDVDVVWVRLGGRGSLVSTRAGARQLLPPTPAVVCDVTGAGDAMVAAYLWASLHGHDPITAARYGTAAAGRTVVVPTTTDPNLDAAALEAAYQSIEGS